MFGSVSQWLYEDLVGIRSIGPGYETIAFRPTIDDGLDGASASYYSVRGLVSTSWRKTATGLELDVKVPANARGVVYVPAPNARAVDETGTGVSIRADKAPAVNLVGQFWKPRWCAWAPRRRRGSVDPG